MTPGDTPPGAGGPAAGGEAAGGWAAPGAGAARAEAAGPGAAGAAVAVVVPAEVPRTAGRRAEELAFPPRERYLETVGAYKDSGFEQLSDLCGVDYLSHPGRSLPPGVRPERFEVVVNLLSLSKRRRVRVRVQVPGDDPVLDTLFDLYPGVEAMERETYDLLGIVFRGHPDLTRILMPEDWEGHPLRKDYGVGRVPVQFKDAPGPR